MRFPLIICAALPLVLAGCGGVPNLFGPSAPAASTAASAAAPVFTGNVLADLFREVNKIKTQVINPLQGMTAVDARAAAAIAVKAGDTSGAACLGQLADVLQATADNPGAGIIATAEQMKVLADLSNGACAGWINQAKTAGMNAAASFGALAAIP